MTTTFEHDNSWTEKEEKATREVEQVLSGLTFIEVRNVLANVLKNANNSTYYPFWAASAVVEK